MQKITLVFVALALALVACSPPTIKSPATTPQPTATQTATSTPAPTDTLLSIPQKTGLIVGDNNLRLHPNTSTGIGVLYDGTEVIIIISTEKGWSLVQPSGLECDLAGWVRTINVTQNQ